jgi:hypothetical protein
VPVLLLLAVHVRGWTVTNLPISPSYYEGVYACNPECPHWRDQFRNCAVDGDMNSETFLCVPKFRELVALSRRRCDGCRHTDDERVCPSLPTLPRGLAPHESCSRWEAKP